MAKMKKFNKAGKERMADYSAIKPGIYKAIVVGSEVKETISKDGSYIKLTYQITKGGYKGRKIWQMYNNENSNKIAVEIAEKELASLCDALMIDNVSNTQDFHDIPMLINVGVVPAKGKYGEQNEIKGYAKVEKKKKKKKTTPWDD